MTNRTLETVKRRVLKWRRPSVRDRIAKSLRLLKLLRDSEHIAGLGPEILKEIDDLLNSEWAVEILKEKS